MQKIIRTATVPLSLNLFCRGLLRELSRDYEVVALSSPGPELDEIAAREGVRTIAVPMRRQISPFRDLSALLRLVRVFRRERPAMVHSMTPKAGLLSMVAARLAGVPVRVHTFTGLLFPTSSGLRRKLLMFTDRITGCCATHVIAEGEGVRNDLLGYGIIRKDVYVLGYGNVRGIDLNYYDRTAGVAEKAVEIRRSLSAGQDTFIFVYSGRIVRDKGIDDLVAAFRMLLDDGCDVRLLLAGDYEPADPLDADTVRFISECPEIYMSGRWLDDVRPWYAAADALVFPSLREGFPNVVIEAGAMGLPSVVTDINGSREIIVDGENGVIVPVKDRGALYKAMKRMPESPARAAAMGECARRRVSERYEQGFVRGKLKEFYATVTG